MVISLFNACRVGIRNGLENGIPLPVHRLPPHMRQPILDMVLMHGTINEPACLAVFGSKEFLDGISVLDTQRGQVNDHAFLNRVTTTLPTVASNGEKLGCNISELRLNLYMKKGYRPASYNLESIIRLISQCSHLVALEIRVVRLDGLDNKDEAKENALQIGNRLEVLSAALWNRYSSVMENLQVFSSFGHSRENATVLESGHPLLKYLKKLTSLHLDNCRIGSGCWKELFGQVGQTLISLHVGPDWLVYGDSVFPASLPNLKSLHIENWQWMTGSEEFITNLKACRQLEHLYLRMCTEWNIPEAVRLDLAGLAAQLEIALYLPYCWADAPIFENGLEFKFINLLGEKVKHFKIDFRTFNWDQRFTSALRHVVEKCQNLISIDLGIWADVSPELGEAKMSLTSLFGDKERARKLTTLNLWGEYDERILESVFENCVNLDRLEIRFCPQRSDRHLIEFAGRGGRLSQISLSQCSDVTGDGLIPILKNSGDKLKYFSADASKNLAYEAAIEFCRYVEWENFRNKDLKDLACLKSFVKVDHLPHGLFG